MDKLLLSIANKKWVTSNEIDNLTEFLSENARWLNANSVRRINDTDNKKIKVEEFDVHGLGHIPSIFSIHFGCQISHHYDIQQSAHMNEVNGEWHVILYNYVQGNIRCICWHKIGHVYTVQVHCIYSSLASALLNQRTKHFAFTAKCIQMYGCNLWDAWNYAIVFWNLTTFLKLMQIHKYKETKWAS